MTNEDELERFAKAPSTWGEPKRILTGEDAAAFGRSLLEGAGVDVTAAERRVGRPRVGHAAGPKGVRSPRVNVVISKEDDDILEKLVVERGSDRSTIVRAALAEYLHKAM